MTPRAPLLVIGIGNPSRGDDALGPLFIERAAAALGPEIASGAVELLTDFQLQIEHSMDIEGRTRVIFVDASVSASPPFELSRIVPRAARMGASYSTHAQSPEALLEVCRAVGVEPPESWTLAIRGERFELGDPLSAEASAHLDAALGSFVAQTREQPVASGRRIEITGIVQGVGFRPWLYRTACGLGLTGKVWNTVRGVTVDAFGAAAAHDALMRAIQNSAPAAARVREVRASPIPLRDEPAFVIAESDAGDDAAAAAMVLPPDLATCDDCVAEMNDPSSRYHQYPFTSCTACGPRFSVACALPYDRATTTMAGFRPCAACAQEYARPADRRFHAQTVACAACGPRLWMADPEGQELPTADPLAAAAAQLLAGRILGLQGLGAFHLVCDATSEAAVRELRRRKRRDAQPFAVMVPDLAMAASICELDDASRAALLSSARPIVLAPTRGGVLASAVNGPSRRTGVMLPYTPLHHRLSAKVARPLVMTSGNPSGGPPVIDHAEARALLGALVDAFLLHDRPIARRVEDSVVAASPAGVRVVRRARGFAPSPIRLPAPSPEPVLAVGGHMKNTACLVVGDLAYLTPHLGDLALVESENAWRRDVEGFERLLGVRAEVLAHDLHPNYASTRYALQRTARRHVGVQHHAAHVFAAIAELHLDEPALGIVFDGSGWGPDGTSWGAELLLVDGARTQRVSTFRALPLPGGEHAIRDVWRVALAVLCEAFGPKEALALAAKLRVFDAHTNAALATVARMVETDVATVRARGMGRWFDAVGALALSLPRASFDGHVAIALEEAAQGADAPPYAVTLPAAMAFEGDTGPAHEVDLRPTVRAAVQELLAGASPGHVSARFHQTVVEATSTVASRILAATGLRRVVLSGGSFQNRILESGLRARLGASQVSMAREAPVNDGGIALGQAWAAVLALRAESPRASGAR